MLVKNDGQIIISGLIFFIIGTVISLLFLCFAHILQTTYNSSQETQINSLINANNQAQVLNEIALNNQNILSALIIFANAFLQSSELGIYLSYSEPYWKVYNAQKYKDGENTELFKRLEEIYHSYYKKGARGLILAKGYSERNSTLLKKLSMRSSRYLKKTTLSDALCFALKIQDSFLNSPGVYDIPLYENLYNFYLHDDDCILRHEKNILSEVLNPDLELIFSSDDSTFYDMKEFLNAFDKDSLKIGLTLFKSKESLESFLESLVLFNNKKYLDKDISFLYKSFFYKILRKKTETSFLVNSWSALIHPEFNCFDFRKQNFYRDCQVSFEAALRALFLPYWTAITHKVEKISEDRL